MAILANPKFKHLEHFLNKRGECICYIAQNGNSVEPSIYVTAEKKYAEEAER